MNATRRQDYEPTVRALMPASDGEDMEIRCSLLLMRDCAASAKRYCSNDAWPVMDQVERLAGDYAFRTMPIEKYRGLRDALRKLVAACACLDAVADEADGGNARTGEGVGDRV
jgi:hypothetical protein